ncbi:MAG: OmpP1/FadL family transporter, partial [bacterium]
VNAAGSGALGNSKSGVYLDDATAVSVGGTQPAQQNIIAFNGPFGDIEFVQQDIDSELDTFLDLSTMTLDYNDIYDSIYHTWLDQNQNVKAKLPVLSLDTLGVGNFFSDPYFIDPNLEDYRLLSFSPCIDQGDPNVDCSLEPEPNGGRSNLGFYGNTSQATTSIDFDGDGPKDFQEGVEDMDGDGLPDWQDPDATIIPLPWGRQKIGLVVEDSSEDSNSQNIGFRKAQSFVLSDLDVDPPCGFIPFGAIQFDVINLKNGSPIDIKMLLPENYGALSVSQYLALSPNETWSSVPFEADPDKNVIFFTLRDGAPEDMDGETNGVIEHLSLILIPRSEEWDPHESCFISLMSASNPKQKTSYLSSLSLFKKKIRVNSEFALFIFLSSVFFPVFVAVYLKNHAIKKITSDQIKGVFKRRHFSVFPFIFILLFCAFVTSHPVHAEDLVDMQMNASPNPVGSGARALGIGGAFIAVGDDATAASWNPAALLKLKRPEMSVAGSFFSGKRHYDTSPIEGQITDITDDAIHLNYFSLVYPFFFLRRNMVVSLNYQHLYEFSLDTDNRWLDSSINMLKTSLKKQKGSLNTLSPAIAFQLIPSLYIGLTANFWLEDELNNQWENLNIIKGEGIEGGERIETYAKLYEQYKFSGFNTHIGFLWRSNRWFSLGGVVKTPFKANIKRKWEFTKTEEYPNAPQRNYYYADSDCEDLTLKMPVSYGLGISVHFSDSYLMSLDIYKTHWKDYLICFPSGKKYSPINNEQEDESNIKDTIQVRLGAEYLLLTQNKIIPFRFGLFYDPEPASGRVDHFYGASLGTGLQLTKCAFDMGYQYRFGKKEEAEFIDNREISAKISQHYIYASLILYF